MDQVGAAAGGGAVVGGVVPPANEIDAYALGVVAGEIPAGRYHRLACERHLRDRSREGSPDFPYRFDYDAAARFFQFAELLKHYKGKWAGQRIKLEPYQRFRLGSLFAWSHVETGLRRFRYAYHELPRKQGKTLEAAIVALYVTFFDREPGAEGYCIATKRDQAKIVFKDCQALVRSSGLAKRIKVQVSALSRAATQSSLGPLGADGDSTDGLNPHFVCVDEYHALKDRVLIDVMETATGARNQPVIWQITTAGKDLVSPCGDQHEYAVKILEGLIVDDGFFAFIAHADVTDDWLDERTWIKANPNWGVSVNPDDMRALALKARNMPSAAATFKQKRLNIWIKSDSPCLSVDGWRRGQSSWTVEDMLHERCFVGVDMSAVIDLAAVAFVFPPAPGRSQWRAFAKIWTPEATMDERALRDRAPYRVWADQGWLTPVPGMRFDQNLVREALAWGREVFDIERVGLDPWHAGKLVEDLTGVDGFDPESILTVSQTFAGMSAACLEVQASTLSGQFDARGCPVMSWAASNCVPNEDGKGNLMFSKKRSRGRIDPVIAATIGVALSLREAAAEPESVYLTRGVRRLGE